MTHDPKETIPPELAGIFNLMAHPAAFAASSAALSFGLASHFYGMWAGAVAGSLEASQRMLETQPGAKAVRPYRQEAAPVARTRAMVDTLIADAESTAHEVAKAADAVAGTAKRPKARAKPAPAAGPEAAGTAPKAIARPAKPDDLKRIAGIGPKLEEVLNGMGVWTYGQIAAWQPAEIEWIEDYLAFRGRVARDGWIEQAASLAGKRKGGR